ncbi:ABC transporter permease [Advenella alkanexedens]|uniref:ABC transporter permease n=2 Tax=Advenella alkanexedens TaxID=1481665 RepID=A0ABS6NNB9_9BURK|nr:ABC transporter permease [Advenella alkanexedens]
MLILLVPLLATFLYSISTSWGATILPDALSLKWYVQLWSDPRFLMAFGRSVLLCMVSIIVSLLVILPLAFMMEYRYRQWRKIMDLVILLPFAMPPIVATAGLLQIYAGSPMMGTPWILVGCYFTIVLPFMYRSLVNNLRALNLHDLMDASSLLGASSFQAFMQVVLPNIRKGIASAWFIAFSLLFGEFVFANMLVGTRFETLQIYLFNMRQTSGHFTSAIVISYFVFILLFTLLANRFNKA